MAILPPTAVFPRLYGLPSAVALGICALVARSSYADPIPAKPSDARQSSRAAKASRTHPKTSGWFADVHLGNFPAPVALTGDGSLPSSGMSFPVNGGGSSHTEDSSYFGAGAALQNAANASAGFAGTISPLDSVLTNASVSRASGHDFGASIGHSITQYAMFEASFDRNSGLLSFSSSALDQIEASRSSVQALWTSQFTPSSGNISNAVVTSNAAISDHVGSERLFSVVGNFNAGTYGGITPYFTIGAGFLLQNDAPSFTMTGRYTFTQNSTGAAFDGTDAVAVTYSVDPAIVEVIGGGVRAYLTSRIGVNVEFRMNTAKLGGGLKIKVQTNPNTVQTTGKTSTVVRGFGNTSVQYTNSPNNTPSTFPNFPDSFTSFESSSPLKTKLLTVGFFVRF